MIVNEGRDFKGRRNLPVAMPAALLGLLSFTGRLLPARTQEAAPTATAGQATASAKSVGTVKSVAGKTITLAPESGGELNVVVQDGARVLRVEPGSTDLKNAAPLALEDLQSGDRILVRGKTGADGKSLLAVSVIAMKKGDLAEKHAHERADWQKNGVGGLVTAVDPVAGTVQIDTSTLGGNKHVTVTTTGSTVLRRYAAGSVNFDEATAAPLDQIKVGDQLRARGSHSADGGSLAAVEIVSGSFRNIAGTIASVDANTKSITVNDLATKKLVTVKVAAISQLKKLPEPMAQRIAARLKGNSGEGPNATGGQNAGATAPSARPGSASGAVPRSSTPNAPNGADPGPGGRQSDVGGGTSSGARQTGSGAGADLQQALSQVPAAALADLRKGDAVIIVATSDPQNAGVTAITLLAGVEPILQASPNSGQSILTPWSLNGAPGGDAAAQ
jgi:Domain of unknown function (DUF5666)